MTPTAIVYHAGCWDGFGAAMVLADHFRAAGVEFELIPGHYGMTPPDCTGREVFVVDFSFPPDEMRALAGRASRLVWLDHHKTAIEAVEDVDAFCESKLSLIDSGIRLAWYWVHGGARAHWLVNYIEDRDLWRRQLPGSDAVTMWVRSHEMTAEAWASMWVTPLREAKTKGAAMLAYHRRLVDNAAAQAVQVEIGGVPMPLVSCSYDLGSDVCDRIIVDRSVPVAAYWLLNRQGDYQYGFRSTAEFDCSALAVRFGGGGHAQAAGCKSPTPLHRVLS